MVVAMKYLRIFNRLQFFQLKNLVKSNIGNPRQQHQLIQYLFINQPLFYILPQHYHFSYLNTGFTIQGNSQNIIINNNQQSTQLQFHSTHLPLDQKLYVQKFINQSLNIQNQVMSYQNQSFGMMDEGYFVPRTEILTWLNNLLNLNLTKIQQLGSGAVYCQVIDVIHPGKVGLSKVNWKARNDYEFINNLKILQNAFDKIGIKRHVEVQKLARAKYQDNLEFIQWLKRYFDLNCGERGNNYKPDERRGTSNVDFSFAEKNVVPKTYNGSGAVVKNQVYEKKKPATKVEDVPRKSMPTTNTGVPKQVVSMKKKEEASQGTSTSLQQKVENKVDVEAIQNEYQEKINELQIEIHKFQKEKHDEAQKNKSVSMKLDMIKEILKTEDEPDMKIVLIQQLLNEE